MAALIKQSSNVETDLEPGDRGEFSVWVDGVKVAQNDSKGFPGDVALLETVARALTLR